jgi:hypothetical protein
MADVNINKSRGKRFIGGVTPSIPSYPDGTPPPIVNPPGTIGGPSNFISLTDTPATYSGQASKVVSVKSDESGLEFVSGGGGGLWTDATTHIYSDSKVVIGQTALPTNSTFSVTSKSPINSSNEFAQFFTSNGEKSVFFRDDTGAVFDTNFGTSYFGKGYNSNNYGLVVEGKSGISGIRYAFKVRTSAFGDMFTIYSDGNMDVNTPNFKTGLPTINLATNGVTFKSNANANDSFTGFVLQSNNGGGTPYVKFAVGGRYEFTDRRMWVGNPSSPIATGSHFKGTANASSANPIFQIDNSVNVSAFQVRGNYELVPADGGNFVLGSITGTKICTATSQKLSFWNKNPIIQPTTSITASTFVANSSGIANDTATYGGYTMGQIAAALINTGLLA